MLAMFETSSTSYQTVTLWHCTLHCFLNTTETVFVGHVCKKLVHKIYCYTLIFSITCITLKGQWRFFEGANLGLAPPVQSQAAQFQTQPSTV